MDGQTDARKQIDRIIYLASLVSEPLSVDTTLDELRAITASSRDLSTQDVEKLKSIQAELESYLIHKERLRSFTEESLRENVERHFAVSNPVQHTRKVALGQISIAVLAASVITGTLSALRLMHGQVVLAFFICTLFIGLAVLFHSYKKDLVSQLHGSLNYLMAAVICNGFFALNFPVIAANEHLEQHPMFQHGGFLIGAIPVYIFYYTAFYLYAKQLDASIPAALRPKGVAITAFAIAIISALLPHPVAVSHEIYFDIAVIGFAVGVYLSGVAGIVAFKTVPKTTKTYSKSTLFMAIAMTLMTIGNANFLIFVTFISGDFSVNEQKGQILTGLLIMAGLASLYIAAYKTKTSLR